MEHIRKFLRREDAWRLALMAVFTFPAIGVVVWRFFAEMGQADGRSPDYFLFMAVGYIAACYAMMVFHTSRKRTCPSCDDQMEMDGSGSNVVYRCRKCGLDVETNMVTSRGHGLNL